MTKTKSTLTAAQVLDVLRERQWKGQAYEMLREVRDGTGYAANRSADALIVSTWPSRGIWFGGVEVKVARNDWKKELEQPAKSHSIQRFCKYWWIATPPDIVRAGELPETWGHFEVTAGGVKLLKEAPVLECEELSPTFVASILRNHASNQHMIEQAAHIRGYTLAEERFKGGAGSEALRNELQRAEMDRDIARRDLKRQADIITKFEETTGISLDQYRYHPELAPEQFMRLRRAVETLRAADMGLIEMRLIEAANEVRRAREDIDGAAAKNSKPIEGAA